MKNSQHSADSYDAAQDDPRKPGRPPIAGEPADRQIQLRVTRARKNAYVRAAKPRKLTAWIFEQLDKAAGYQPEMCAEVWWNTLSQKDRGRWLLQAADANGKLDANYKDAFALYEQTVPR